MGWNREKTVAALAALILLVGLVRLVPALFRSSGESAFHAPRIPEARGSSVAVEPTIRFSLSGEEPLRDPFRVASAWRPVPPPRLGYPPIDPVPRLLPPLSYTRGRGASVIERERKAPEPVAKDPELDSLVASLRKLDAASAVEVPPESSPPASGDLPEPSGDSPEPPDDPPLPEDPPADEGGTSRAPIRGAPILAAAAGSAPAPPPEIDEEIREFDTLVLKDGTTFEGFILKEDPVVGIVSFELKERGIKFDIETDRLARIIRRQSAQEIYKRKIARASVRSAREQFDLGRWCLGERVGMRAEARKHILLAIHRDPALQEAYPYFLDLASDKPIAEKTEEELAEEAEVCVLARRAGLSSADLEYRLAQIAERLDLSGTAEEAYRAAIAAAPPESTIARRSHLALAAILVSQDREEEALEEYDALSGAGADWEFVPLWEQARILVARGAASDLERASKALVRAAEIQPDFPGVAALRATIAARRNDLSLARQLLIEAVRLGPDLASVRADLGIVVARLGYLDAASSLFALARARDPACLGALLGEGFVAARRDESAAALASFRAAAEAHPESAVARAFLASALVEGGASEEARKELAELARLARESAPVFTAFARETAELALREGDLAKARRYLGYALEHMPQDGDLWLRLAHVALRAGDAGGAATALEKTESLDPGWPTTSNVRGYIAYEAGELVVAETCFRKSSDAFPAPKTRRSTIPRPPQAAYAESALEKIDDARTLEVWSDLFAREDAPEAVNGWNEDERFGVEVKIAGRMLVLEGEQRNEPDGVTAVERSVAATDVERIEARIRVAPGTRVRAGLRLENERRTGGVVFFRDLDGTMSFRTRAGNEWREPPKPESAATGFHFDATAKWPEDGVPHTLLIRRT
ncbi:MAG: tetratricopeptide repeat protein, partial [Planctomycetes bacterium]|nr:tetratricopeptide repeat protein [Planctomycetota bacterium]